MRNTPPPPPPLLRLRGPLFWAMRHLRISHNAPYLPSKILHKHCFQFLLGRAVISTRNEKQRLCKIWAGVGEQKRCIMGDVQVAYVLCLRLSADCKLSIFLSLPEMWQCMKYRQVVKWVEFSMCIVTSFNPSCPLQSLLQTFGDCCVTKL